MNGQTPGPELRFVQGDAVEVSKLKVYNLKSTHSRVSITAINYSGFALTIHVRCTFAASESDQKGTQNP